MSEMSEMIRRVFAETDAKRDEGLTTPDEIVRYDNIVYGSNSSWQVLDVYRPKAVGDEPLPVIVSVHGGAWVYGSKEGYQFYCMDLARRGFAVVNFSYRLAPEDKFPASVEDTALVFAWVLNHAEEYGFDTNNVFAVGDSAGAHNLGMFCAMCTNPEYAKKFPFAVPDGFVPKAVALSCGAYWMTMSDRPEHEFETKLMLDYLPEQGSEEELRLVNVIDQIECGFPPTFLMTAEEDFLKVQAPVLAQKLTEKNVPFVYRYYCDKNVKLGHVFHLDIRTDAAALCNDEQCAFFHSYLSRR